MRTCAIILLTQSIFANCLALVEPVRITSWQETKQCTLAFIQDASGADFVVKQRKGANPKDHFRMVSETLSSYVAAQVGIHVHGATIAGPGTCVVGKPQDEFPAVILTHVAGRCIGHSKGPYDDLNIKQYWHEYDHPYQEAGFTRTLIYHMSRHGDLPGIVALDLFIGNPDRSKNNIFYDKNTDSFCGIDMEAAFHKNMCKASLAQIERLLDTTDPLSRTEYKGLKKFTAVFAQLIEMFPPDTLYQKYLEFAKQAGFVAGSPLLTHQVYERRIVQGKQLINESYQDAIKVFELLTQVIGAYEHLYA